MENFLQIAATPYASSTPELIANPHPNAAAHAQARLLLQSLLALQGGQRQQLEAMGTGLRTLILQPTKAQFEELASQMKALHQHLTQEATALQMSWASTIHTPVDMQLLLSLKQEVRSQQQQLELFAREMSVLANPKLEPPPVLLTLTISEDPFPLVITKGRSSEETTAVLSLHVGASVAVASASPVLCTVVPPATLRVQLPKIVEEESVPLAASRLVQFPLKFGVGTRKLPMRLRFSLQVQLANRPDVIVLESEMSKPFVVITNEYQWEEVAGVLLLLELFGEQRVFLQAVRQKLTAPGRCLSHFDLAYFHQKFFGWAPQVTRPQVTEFWGWFGKILQRLRYQKPLWALLEKGLIYGFLPREGVEDALRSEQVGAFLIRFSEKSAGSFAIGYKIANPDPSQCIRHYLVRPTEDLAGGKKSLPDFLSEQPALATVLQITIDGLEGGVVKRKCPKDAVFEPFYTKRQAQAGVYGYDDQLATRAATGPPPTLGSFLPAGLPPHMLHSLAGGQPHLGSPGSTVASENPELYLFGAEEAQTPAGEEEDSVPWI